MKFSWKHILCGGVVLWTTGCGDNETKDVAASGTGEAYTLPAPKAGEDTGLGPGGGGPGAGGPGGGGPGGGGPAGLPGDPVGAGGGARGPSATPVTVVDGSIALTPETTRIVFVGTHAPPKEPDPRTGGFEKFVGKAAVADGRITSIEVEIDTNSIFSFQDGLTTHLKGADFFEVNEFPNAKFASTKIEGDGGSTTITGDLTLHGTTKPITFPANVNVSDEGVTLEAEFSIDRFDFGMNGVKDGVLPEVQLKIAIGQPTNKQQILSGGRGGRGGGRGGRGNFNPMEMFAERDADKDGKLSGDEIPERMQGFVERIDTDGDGAISKEEMEAMAQRMREGGGRGGRGGGGGKGGSGRPQRPGGN